jgi:hypothetical protein
VISSKKIFTLLTLALFFPLFADYQADIFWTENIENAITIRNDFLKTRNLTKEFNSLNNLSVNEKNAIHSKLNVSQALHNSWHYFIKGMISQNSAPENADSLFSFAIKTTRDQPGTTWLLFAEFSKYNLVTFENQTLEQLEKQLFESGAQSSFLISSFLVDYAYKMQLKKRSVDADRLFTWAEKFDPNQTRTIRYRLTSAFPPDFQKSKILISRTINLLINSWNTQIEFITFFYHWMRIFLWVAMLAIIGVLAIKYSPKSFHSIVDLFPHAVQLPLRFTFSTILIFSLLFYGILPFLWVILILTWRFTQKNEKIFLFGALGLLILVPLDARINVTLKKFADPDYSLTMYHKATTEGYSEVLYKKVITNFQNPEKDPLCFLSAAILAYKNSCFESANSFTQRALSIAPHDPVILTLAGNIAFQQGDLNEAVNFFEEASGKALADVSSKFNLAQCLLLKMETIKGAEIMNNAGRQSNTVNNFITQNDKYFSKNWPSSRKLMLPTYSPAYFWENIALRHSATWDETNQYWGLKFLGISAKSSLWIFFVLSIITLITSLPSKNIRIKKHSECRYCGKIICRRCAKGILCSSCYSNTEFVKNSKKIDKIRISIKNKVQLFISLRQGILDFIFPGAGMFLDSTTSSIKTGLVITISCILYSFAFFVLNINRELPLSLNVIFIPALLIVYNLAFGIRRTADFLKLLKSLPKLTNES